MHLLASSSRTEARIIAHLVAVEERRLHLEAGNRSMFDYCCRRLGLSESEAFHRLDDLAAVIERALDLLIERTLKERFAQTSDVSLHQRTEATRRERRGAALPES